MSADQTSFRVLLCGLLVLVNGSCSTTSEKSEARAPVASSQDVDRDPAATTAPSLIDCSLPENAHYVKEIQYLVKAYYTLLGDNVKRINREAGEAARARGRATLLNYLQILDPKTCFKEMADLTVLCPQLQIGVPILETGVSGAASLQSGDFAWEKGYFNKQGKYSKVWVLKAKDGSALAQAIDNDEDGFIDEVRLSEGVELERYENDVWFGSYKWRVVGYQSVQLGMKSYNLKNAPFGNIFSAMSTYDKCLSSFANPVEMVNRLSDSTGWSQESIYYQSNEARRYEIIRARSIGLGKGARGWATGVGRGFSSLGEFLAMVGTMSWKGGKAGWGMIKAVDKFLQDSLAAIDQRARSTYMVCLRINDNDTSLALTCLIRNGGADAVSELARRVEAGSLMLSRNILAASEMADEKLHAIFLSCFSGNQQNWIPGLACVEEALGKAGATMGHASVAVGKWIAKTAKNGFTSCFSTSSEKFAECMGGVSFLAGTAAAGGAVKELGARWMLLGTPLAKVAGRTGVFLSEWVIDQVGVTAFSKGLAVKLEKVLGEISVEGMSLVKSGKALTGLTVGESQRLLDYLMAVARHEYKPNIYSKPAVLEDILKKLSDEDKKLLEHWKTRIAATVKEAVKVPFTLAKAKEHLMAEEFDPVSADRIGRYISLNREFAGFEERTYAIIVALGPEVTRNPVQRNAILGAIKDLNTIYGKNLDPDYAVQLLREWDNKGITGLLMVLKEAKTAKTADDLKRALGKAIRQRAPQASHEQIQEATVCAEDVQSALVQLPLDSLSAN